MMGFLSAFLIIGLCMKVNKIDNKKIETTWLIEKMSNTDNVRSQTWTINVVLITQYNFQD
jgi:hypothetical protein